MAETRTSERSEDHGDEPRRPERGERLTATEARQGEVVLGRFGRVLWIVVFAVLILGVAIFGF